MADLEKRDEKEPASVQDLEGSGGNSIESTNEVDEKKLMAKVDLRLLPIVSILYLLSFLDRSNVANARVEGLATDLHITGDQYLTGLTLFFIGYILFEVPWNIILKRTSPKLWLPTITFVWGVNATLLGVVQSLAGFYVARFFLGLTEGGLFPGVVWYLSMWYKRRERQYRVALFFSAASLAGAFGGILAYGIAFMKGDAGLNGWRWIFIIEGIVTCVISAFAYFFVTSWPSSARWLSDDEKATIHQRLKLDSDATNEEGFTWSNVLKAFKDPKCYLYCAAFHTMSLPLYTLSLFLPTIITSLGYSAANAQLLTVPPYALATILTVVVAVVSEKVGKRAPFMMACSFFAIIGYIILLSNHSTHEIMVKSTTNPTKKVPMGVVNNPGISYLGVFFAAGGIYPSTALALSWPAVNVSGQTKRAVACAMQITIGNLGAVLGTQLYRTETAPTYALGHGFALGYLAANMVVAGVIWLVLSKENKRRDAIEKETSPGENGWEGDDDLRWRFTT